MSQASSAGSKPPQNPMLINAIHCLSHSHHVHRGSSQVRPRTVRQHSDLRPVQAGPAARNRPANRGFATLVDMTQQSFQLTALGGHKYQQLHVTVRAKPIHSAFQSAIHRPRIESQFTLRLVERNEHFLARHFHRVDRRPRLVTGQIRPAGARQSGGIGDRVGDPPARSFSSADGRQTRQDLLQRQIFATQDVALAARARARRPANDPRRYPPHPPDSNRYRQRPACRLSDNRQRSCRWAWA